KAWRSFCVACGRYRQGENVAGRLMVLTERMMRKSREVTGAAEKLENDLSYVGLVPSESITRHSKSLNASGPLIGGQYGPYIQSHRIATYRNYANSLLQVLTE